MQATSQQLDCLLQMGRRSRTAASHLDHILSDAALAASGPLLRELCALPSTSELTALSVGVRCGFVDIIASALDDAFEDLGYGEEPDCVR